MAADPTIVVRIDLREPEAGLRGLARLGQETARQVSTQMQAAMSGLKLPPLDLSGFERTSREVQAEMAEIRRSIDRDAGQAIRAATAGWNAYGAEGAAATQKVTKGMADIAREAKQAGAAVSRSGFDRVSGALSRPIDDLRSKGGGSLLTGAAMGLASAGATAAIAAASAAVSALGSAITDTVRVGMEFDATMSRVAAKSNASAEEMAAMREQAIALGASTTFSATEVAAAMVELVAAGMSSSEAMAALPGTLAAAASEGMELAAAATIMSDTLTQFDLPASDAARVADMLAQAANESSAGITDLGNAMRYAAPAAASLGLSVEDTTAAVMGLAQAGIRGEQAGTTLRGGILAIVNPSKQAAEAMEGIGLSATDAQGKFKPFPVLIGEMASRTAKMTETQRLQTIAQIVGTEASSGFLALMRQGQPVLEGFRGSLEGAAGAAEKVSAIQMDNLSGDIEELGGKVETLKIRLFEAADSPLRDVVQALGEAVADMTTWVEENAESLERWGVKAGDLVRDLIDVAGAIGSVGSQLGALYGVLPGVSDDFNAFEILLVPIKVGLYALDIAARALAVTFAGLRSAFYQLLATFNEAIGRDEVAKGFRDKARAAEDAASEILRATAALRGWREESARAATEQAAALARMRSMQGPVTSTAAGGGTGVLGGVTALDTFGARLVGGEPAAPSGGTGGAQVDRAAQRAAATARRAAERAEREAEQRAQRIADLNAKLLQINTRAAAIAAEAATRAIVDEEARKLAAIADTYAAQTAAAEAAHTSAVARITTEKMVGEEADLTRRAADQARANAIAEAAATRDAALDAAQRARSEAAHTHAIALMDAEERVKGRVVEYAHELELAAITDEDERRRIGTQRTYERAVAAAERRFALDELRISATAATEAQAAREIAIARLAYQDAIGQAETERVKATADAEREAAKEAADRWRDFQRETTQKIESGLTTGVSIITEAARARRQISDNDAALQRDAFKRQEKDLQESLARQEITHEQYSMQVKRLAEDRAAYEKRVEVDKRSFLERSMRGLVDSLIAELVRLAVKQASLAIFKLILNAATGGAGGTAGGFLFGGAGAGGVLGSGGLAGLVASSGVTSPGGVLALAGLGAYAAPSGGFSTPVGLGRTSPAPLPAASSARPYDDSRLIAATERQTFELGQMRRDLVRIEGVARQSPLNPRTERRRLQVALAETARLDPRSRP